jgi:hypothetical protein
MTNLKASALATGFTICSAILFFGYGWLMKYHDRIGLFVSLFFLASIAWGFFFILLRRP